MILTLENIYEDVENIYGNWYYFYSDGYMAYDTVISGCFLNNSGARTIMLIIIEV